MTDTLAHAARAAEIWAHLEKLLLETGALSDDARLLAARAKCIALLARLVEGLPLPPLHPESRPPSPPEGGSRLSQPMEIIPPVRSRPVKAPPAVSVGTPVWIDRGDTLTPPTTGPGYSCRKCGLRVRGARHTDPRLLCHVCASHQTPTPPAG